MLRTARCHSTVKLSALYRSHILSCVEYRTAAIAHAATTTLYTLDLLQVQFLAAVGVTEREALLVFHLPPLSLRRDIAILGVLHRAALGIGPRPLRYFHMWVMTHLLPGHLVATFVTCLTCAGSRARATCCAPYSAP